MNQISVTELIFYLGKKTYLRPITVIIEIVGASISARSDWFVWWNCRIFLGDEEGGESSSFALDVTERMHNIQTFIYLIHRWII